jgi:hypothetical protein
MKASELRIGNLIHNKQGNIVYVNTNHLTLLSYGIENEFNPIPLTEEWLIKFGFSREAKVGSEMGTDGVEFRVYHFDVLTFNTNHGWWYKVQRINDTPLEYVHQLQNFYFALTGEEFKQQEQ